MRKTLKYIDYITKDYEGFRKLMIDLIPSKTPEWTDTSQSDMGIVILELLAHGLDVLSYYQDKQFNEAFLPTAKTRKAVINLSRALGYELSPQLPSRFTLTVTKSSEYLDEDIVIVQGTKIGTDPNLGSPITFETDSELLIPAGTLSGAVNVTQGITIDNDIVGVGDDSESQKFTLSNPDVLISTLQVSTYLRTGESQVNLVNWTRVSDFLSSTPEDKHFITYLDEFNNTIIEFGTGRTGMKVPTEYNVQCSYRIGGGVIGNVGLKTINTLLDTEIAGITSISNDSVALQLGVDLEDIEHAKLSAPKLYRTQKRAITSLDFEDLVSTYEGIGKAKAVEQFNLHDDINIYLTSSNYTVVTDAKKTEILDYLNQLKLIHVNPILLDAVYLDFDIEINVTAQSNYVNDQVKFGIIARLQDAFSLDYMEFDEDILVASIYKEVLSVEGVKNLTLVTPTADISVHDTTNNVPRLPRLRNVTVNVTGGVTV